MPPELLCPACGAPVLDAEPGRRAWCTACDAVFDVPEPPPAPPVEPPPPAPPEPGPFRRPWQHVVENRGLVAVVFTAGLLAGLGLSALFRDRPQSAPAPVVAAGDPTGDAVPAPPAAAPNPAKPDGTPASTPKTPEAVAVRPAPLPPAPAPAPRLAVRGVYLPAGRGEVVPLPGKAADACVGGGGRYLVFRIGGKAKLAVFDTWAGKVRELPLAEETPLVAAGSDRIVAVYPGAGRYQTWNLVTLEKEKSAELPRMVAEETPGHVCMGSASRGPLFVYQPRKKRTLTLDLDTASASQVHWHNWGPNNAYGPLHMRATPDGSRLVGWSGGWAGTEVAEFRGGEQRGVGRPLESSWLWGSGGFYPSADGRLVIAPRGVLNPEYRRAEVRVSEDTELIPTREPGFFIALLAAHRRERGRDDVGPEEAVVFGEDRQELFTLRGPEELVANTLTWDKRVFYYPRSGLLVLVGNDGDRLILKRVDLAAELDRAGADCLLVVSRPPAAVPGKRFDYQIEAVSRRGGVKCSLDGGPTGMTVTAAGRMTWDVPADFAEAAKVAVTVTDSGGHEALHAFELNPPGR